MARRQGFTLIELLIVIAIIGILAAVLVPNLLHARETAQTRAALLHTKNVYLASTAYLAEDPDRAEVLGDCTNGYSAGDYTVHDPKNARIASCVVGDSDSDGYPEVTTVMVGGATITYP